MKDTPTVLVVDDYQSALRLFQSYLSAEYEVLTAHDGNKALEKVNDDVDIIYLDRNMPQLHGDKTLNKLRERGYTIPIALITCEKPTEKLLTLPCDDYISKPVEREELLVKTDQLLKRKELCQEAEKYLRLEAKRTAFEREANFDEEVYDKIRQKIESLRPEVPTERVDSYIERDPTITNSCT